MRKFLICTFIVLLIKATFPAEDMKREITLEEIILQTFKNNLNIKIEKYNRSIAAAELGITKSIFDPLFLTSYTHSKEEFKTASSLIGQGGVLSSKSDVFDTSIEQLLFTGGTLKIGYDNSRYWTNSAYVSEPNPYYESHFRISLEQPLLKEFGTKVTFVAIKRTNLGRRIAFQNYRVIVENQLAQAVRLYWNLIFTLENLRVRELSLKRAEKLLGDTKKKYEVGYLPVTSVLQAEAGVAKWKESLITAADLVRNVEDEIKKLTNNVGETERDIRLIPKDKPVFESRDYPPLKELLAVALINRADYNAAKLLFDQLNLDAILLKNQKLPDLNLFANYSLQGFEDSAGGATSNIDSDQDSWQAGLSLSYPIFNRKGKNQYRRIKAYQNQQELRLKNLENSITIELKKVLRQLVTDGEKIDAAQVSVKSEKAKLSAEMKRYEVGEATSYDILTYQEDLANAQISLIKAKTDYLKSKLALELFKGTILIAFNFDLEPDKGEKYQSEKKEKGAKTPK